MDGDKCLGFIRPFIGAHLVGSWHLLQSFMAMLTWQYLPGLSIYLWLLSFVFTFFWIISIFKDSAKMRNLLYLTYSISVGVSAIWGCIGPWILRGGFWANNCYSITLEDG